MKIKAKNDLALENLEMIFLNKIWFVKKEII